MTDEAKEPQQTTSEAPEENSKVAEDRAQAARERAPKAKAGKIIVRNLVFDLREKHLTSAFKKYGKIKEVNVPLN